MAQNDFEPSYFFTHKTTHAVECKKQRGGLNISFETTPCSIF